MTHRVPHPAGQLSLPIDQIREWAAQGQSLEDMAQKLGCSRNGVWKAMKRHNIPRLPQKARPGRNHFWNGGRTTDKDGYILVKAPDHPHATTAGYVREHRLVMESALKRYLEPTETVHHLDGNPGNNTIANLQLHQSNGTHLAETLKGQRPNWSEDGRQKILAGVSQPRSEEARAKYRVAARLRVEKRRNANLAASGSGDLPSL